MVTAQILKVATEGKDGTHIRPVTGTTLKLRPLRCRQSQHSSAAGVDRCCRSKARRRGKSRGSEDGGTRSKVFVISFLYRPRWRLNILLRGTDRARHSQMVFAPRPLHKL